ncbi:unnamed protein product [Euphydryas editha]|uniref:Uncharacterized protein n=1 Tax=Euphydryas editha TaxID=104508 RepID=A0AAU9UHV7_EUPED|nr:unnamed protein product [Euphydryas editha]
MCINVRFQKRNSKPPCQRRAGRAGRWGATGRAASCRTSRRPPSARPPRAASPRCHPWRRPGARASSARGSSSSVAASTSSASCAPTATPTPRSTTATTSSDRPAPRPHRPPRPPRAADTSRYSRIDEYPGDLGSSPRTSDPGWSEITYRCGHKSRFLVDRDPYHPNWNRYSSKTGQSESNRVHSYTMNALTTDYANIPMSSLRSGNTLIQAQRVDSKHSINDRRYSLNFSDICSELAKPCRRNDGRVLSWSLSNLNSLSHIPREEQTGKHRSYVSVIKIQSADNIRKLHKDLNFSVKDKLKPSPSNADLLDDLNSAIYCQPRKNKDQLTVQSMDAKGGSNSARNSVVHWTNSVENRVCCPIIVFTVPSP